MRGAGTTVAVSTGSGASLPGLTHRGFVGYTNLVLGRLVSQQGARREDTGS